MIRLYPWLNCSMIVDIVTCLVHGVLVYLVRAIDYNEDMIKINCLGDMCPIPVVKLASALDALTLPEHILLISDHSCTKVTVENFAKSRDLHFISQEVINGVWEIEIFRD